MTDERQTTKRLADPIRDWIAKLPDAALLCWFGFGVVSLINLAVWVVSLF